jgi:hypothetical protein
MATVPGATRRQFMQSVGMLGAAVGLDAGAPGASAVTRGAETGPGEIPRRALGRTEFQVSAIGVGGHHLGDLPTVDTIRLVPARNGWGGAWRAGVTTSS